MERKEKEVGSLLPPLPPSNPNNGGVGMSGGENRIEVEGARRSGIYGNN